MLPDNYPDQMTPLILEALVGLYAKKLVGKQWNFSIVNNTQRKIQFLKSYENDEIINDCG